ncbi:hypothetical protein ABIB57_000063 [Devosia sp. UYZn731]
MYGSAQRRTLGLTTSLAATGRCNQRFGCGTIVRGGRRFRMEWRPVLRWATRWDALPESLVDRQLSVRLMEQLYKRDTRSIYAVRLVGLQIEGDLGLKDNV